MRVLQLIDALKAGGAERVAVNIANALANENVPSYLVTTRDEGPLKKELNANVNYFFLERKSTLDFKALYNLKNFIQAHKISHIHAHSTSFFIATLVKILVPGIKIIWHLHEGKKIDTSVANNKILWLCSFLFSGIVTVNEELAVWAKKTLKTKKVQFVLNFIPENSIFNISEGKKNHVVCLANLREPKNHKLILSAWNQLDVKYWQLYLIGADYNDTYAAGLKTFIIRHNLEKSVHLLGMRSDVQVLLREASIGVLASKSEGLPMALLEYGAASLGVITTNVGQCPQVVGDAGIVVSSNNQEQFATALQKFMDNSEVRKKAADSFRKQIKTNFTETAILPEILAIYTSV